MSDPVDTRGGRLPFLALLFALSLLLRLPSAGLPLAGDGAALATRAVRMADETAWTLDGIGHRGPLLPILLAIPTASGATPSAALRALDLVLGALLAPLTCALALALGFRRWTARLTGILLTVHPLLTLGAGGALAGTTSLAAVLLLTALFALLGTRPGARRWGLGLAVLLPLAEPPCVAYVPFLLAVWLAREPSARWRIGGVALAVAALVATPFPVRALDAAVGSRILAWALQWLPVAALLGLLPLLPSGTLAGWRLKGRARGVARAWLAGALLYVLLLIALPAPVGFAFGWEGLATGGVVVPLVVLLGVVGLERVAMSFRRGLAGALTGVALAASLFLAMGPLQTWILPESTPPTGRLWRLGRVVAEADAVAGPEGWVAFDVSSALDPHETERLSDLIVPRRSGPLHELPLEALEADLAIVSRYRPEVLDVVTLGGRGIFRQTVLLRRGPWLVLRAVRP